MILDAEALAETMRNAACATLENMLFYEGEPTRSPFPAADAAGFLRCAIAVPGHGRLFLAVDRLLLERIRDEILAPAQRAEPGAAEAGDETGELMKELLNVMAGAVTDGLAGGKSFALALPSPVSGADLPEAGLITAGVEVDGRALFLAFAPETERT